MNAITLKGSHTEFRGRGKLTFTSHIVLCVPSSLQASPSPPFFLPVSHFSFSLFSAGTAPSLMSGTPVVTIFN